MTSSIVRDMVQTIRHDPETTIASWRSLGEKPVLEAMSGEFLRLVTEHHLDALAFDAIERLRWDVRISPYIIAILKRRSLLNEAVYDAHYDALVELEKAAPHLVTQSMIPKGAILGPLYPSLRHRRMTDFDLVLPADLVGELLSVLQDLGYEEEPGGFGHDLVKMIGPKWSWRDRLTMHIFPIKEGYLEHTSAGSIRDVACRQPSPELHVISLLLNSQEHAASFTYASFGSDLQLIRVVDIELLVETHQVDALAVWHLAGKLNVQAEVALGVWAHDQIRGELPPGWDVLKPAVDAVDELGDLVAMPDGQVKRWDVPARDRVFHPNRTDLALRLLSPQQRTADYLADIRRATFQEDEPAEQVVKQAREALQGVGIGS